MSRPRNVLLVTYDCVRVDVAYNGGLQTLERLRARGVTCERAIASAPLTPVSHATVFTGLQPYHHGLRHMLREKLPRGALTLSQHLRRAGYETGAVVACAALNRWYGLNRGFRFYDDEIDPSGGPPHFRRAANVVERGLRWLAARSAEQPWLLFLHFFDAHRPYDPPDGARGAVNAYEGEIRYLDEQLGRVLSWLEERGWLDDTLVTVFADHGEDLDGLYPNDKGGPAGNHPEEFGHGCLLYEQTQHVPLVFAHPSLPQGRIERLVGLVDVAPTICSVLGVPPMPAADGIALTFEPDENEDEGERRAPRVLYAETQYPGELAASGATDGRAAVNRQALWIGERYKIIRAWGDDTQAQAFDLVIDPLEQQPLPLAQLPGDLLIAWPGAGG